MGFFEEIWKDFPNAPTLTDGMATSPYPDEAVLANYLAKGVILMRSTGIARDVLSQEKPVLGSPDVLTDGVWAWPAQLAYLLP